MVQDVRSVVFNQCYKMFFRINFKIKGRRSTMLPSFAGNTGYMYVSICVCMKIHVSLYICMHKFSTSRCILYIIYYIIIIYVYNYIIIIAT